LADDDRRLVEAFLAGDEDAFRQVFRRHSPRLYALALRLTGGRTADAEDTLQECWVRAARRLAGFEWRSQLSTWLTAILINCARERRRRSLPLADADLAQVWAPARSHAEALDLDRAIAALPDGYREVLVLHDVEGYTHAEIGTLLGVSAGTSKSQLFHARRAVRARLSSVSAPTEVGHDVG
jgi:RNA polymerase sigma-70 factor (ECF subfamily)